jgi:hypothetical protein
MYGSYGSYSGMSAPMDINPGSSYRSQESSCAFPSWPRRSSLSDPDSQFEDQRATSYISDEDLFFADTFESDYDSRSISSSSSNSPHQQEQDAIQQARERAAYQREMMRVLAAEKARRQQAKKGSRRSSTSSKKGSPKSKMVSMTPIAEAE